MYNQLFQMVDQHLSVPQPSLLSLIDVAAAPIVSLFAHENLPGFGSQLK